MKRRCFVFLAVLLFAAACNNNEDSQASDQNAGAVPAPVLLSYQVLNRFPHDSLSFTEGLTFFNGQLFESTGSPDDETTTNNTWVGPLDLQNGKYQKKIDLGTSYFGEGITFLHDKLFQLTYKTEIGFVYDAKTFKKLGSFKYKGEGWGMTNDGNSLIMSNGSYNLYYINPDSLTFTRMLAVQDNTGFVSNINELEYIDGYIYANQWLTYNILKIDPRTGYVVGKMDFSRLADEIKAKNPDADTMNGIAYDSASKKTYITGKKWPYIYQISW